MFRKRVCCLGKVVIAEDNQMVQPLLLRFVAEVAEPLGHKVVHCWDGCEAFTEIVSNPADVILLVTDIDMPCMDGYELVRRCIRQNVLRFIIQTGRGLDNQFVEEVLIGNDQLIFDICPKPWDARRLKTAVQEALNA